MLREEEIPYKEEKNDFPGCGEQNKKEEIKILQTFTFLCLAVAVICGMINYLMLETLNWFWFAAAGCACAWLVVMVAYYKRRNILKNEMWQLCSYQQSQSYGTGLPDGRAGLWIL